MSSSTTHLLLTVLPAWGHVRPLCALAGRLVRENNNIAITILLAPNWITQAHVEIARQFPAGSDSDKIRVVSLFDSAETQIFNLFAPHAEAYPAAYAKLARSEAITCATTGTTFKALPAPAALIADFFATEQVKATRAITGEEVPIFSFASGCAVSIIRALGPEKMGGRGDIKARAEAEAQRTGEDVVEIGEQMFKHTEGKIMQLPGLPAVYDYEFCPQNPPFEMPAYLLISGARSYVTLMMADGLILGTLNAYDQEAISALDRWLSGLGKTLYTAGPLLPANYGSDSISSTVSPRDGDIKAFLDTMLAEHGPKSTLFISFGTIFWPTVQEHLEELVDVLTEKKFPFILAHASPVAAVSPALSAKVKASRLGMLTPWCPQQFILNHAATGLFTTHGGHGGVSESLASGIPMVCWPFEGDQPDAALHLTHNLNVAFHLIEIRTGKGKLPLLSGKVPQGTRAAVGAEFRSVIDDFRGNVGEEKKRNAQRMKVEYARAWEDGGSARAAVDALLKRPTRCALSNGTLDSPALFFLGFSSSCLSASSAPSQFPTQASESASVAAHDTRHSSRAYNNDCRVLYASKRCLFIHLLVGNDRRGKTAVTSGVSDWNIPWVDLAHTGLVIFSALSTCALAQIDWRASWLVPDAPTRQVPIWKIIYTFYTPS
ncbi:hypothetical protein C8J57DRAFT_1726485 [Mycena rebaudengoi]|nr:hypothetical protein C8J57DRAFT_1726485 [Mycena rebaudengoi]